MLVKIHNPNISLVNCVDKKKLWWKKLKRNLPLEEIAAVTKEASGFELNSKHYIGLPS